MTATTTAPRPTPARTGATPTRTASTSTSTARTTRGDGRRNTTPPTGTSETTEPTETAETAEPTGIAETAETAVVGAGPAAGSEQRVHAALTAGRDLTVGALAEATGLGRSTVSKALTRLEAAGRAVRTTIGSSGRARQPDRWNPTTITPTTTNAAVPPPSADTPQAQTSQAQTPPVPTSQAQPETPVGSGPGNGAAAGEGPRPTPARKGGTRRPSTQDTPTTSSPSDGRTSPPAPSDPSGPVGPEERTKKRMNPRSGTARLAPGALTQLVADHFGRHPGVPLTSGEIGRALGRSGGAVRNAADKLVGDGALRLLDGAPRRYTSTD